MTEPTVTSSPSTTLHSGLLPRDYAPQSKETPGCTPQVLKRRPCTRPDAQIEPIWQQQRWQQGRGGGQPGHQYQVSSHSFRSEIVPNAFSNTLGPFLLVQRRLGVLETNLLLDRPRCERFFWFLSMYPIYCIAMSRSTTKDSKKAKTSKETGPEPDIEPDQEIVRGLVTFFSSCSFLCVSATNGMSSPQNHCKDIPEGPCYQGDRC